MLTYILTFLAVLAALALVGVLADQRAAQGDKSVTPGLRLLPGDIDYQSPSGNVRVYVPITTSIVVSIVLSLVLWLFR
jgi:hypothetical protein